MREPWSPSDAALSRTALTAFMGDDRLASRIAGRCQVVGLEGRDRRYARPRLVPLSRQWARERTG